MEDHEHAPTVSILTPAYNAEAFLTDSIESVRQQTFTDFELLVVDDGSTDGTAALAARYAACDPRVRLSRQRNLGLAAARNAALARARGRYVALLDSDDIWMPTYLAAQIGILERRPDLAILSANAFNLGGQWDGQPLLPAGHLREIALLDLVRAEDSVSILTVFRREVADRLGGWDTAFTRSEDYDFWLRALASGFRLAVNPQPLAFYRRHVNSLSSNELAMLRSVQAVLKKLRERCADQRDLQAAIDAQLAQLSHRELVVSARLALASGDMPLLAARFDALAASTGHPKYRLARWLTTTAPATVRLAYRLKQVRRRWRPHRSWLGTASSLQPISRAQS
jgi:GT2 family glycosyltransferase